MIPLLCGAEYIDKHAVEVLVMGTVPRSGIAGFIVGNAATVRLTLTYHSTCES